MAGSHTPHLRGGQLAVVFALCCFVFADRAGAQSPSPALPSPGLPAQSLVDAVDAEPTPETTAAPPVRAEPSYDADFGATQPANYSEAGIFDTITESIFGKPDPDTWHPLPFSSLFGEGWNESWVPSPSGSGGAPRQGWINAADGNLYRLSFFTFSQGFNAPPAGNAYLGGYTLLTPLNRRLMLIANIPFVLRNNAATGLPIVGPNQPTSSTSQSFTTFGDVSLTPRVLLHETRDFSLTAEVAVLIPTGNQPLAGKSTLTPAFGFWNNFAGGWVVRGGLGVSIPTQGGGDDVLTSQLAIGQTLTGHDVPLFGDFTWYVSTVAGTPLSSSGGSTVSLTPGIRTHLGRDWYLLGGLPTPLTTQRVADFGMIFWFMKAW